MGNVYKYRLKFAKTGGICFVGHLDLMEVFRRAIKRAKLPVRYSEGFNPHMELSVALPLSTGMAGLGEYLDMQASKLMDADDLVARLNAQMPPGLVITEGRLLGAGVKTSAALVVSALYEVALCKSDDAGDVADACLKILASDALPVEKRGKIVDVRKGILGLETRSSDGVNVLVMRLGAGSGLNAPPVPVAEILLGRAVSVGEITRLALELRDE